MRILHTSDWHLGRTFHGRVLDDAHAAFADHLVELVTAESVDAVLVAGDVYDRAIPPNEAVALLDETLRRLTERTEKIEIQLNQIENFIASGVDALIVLPQDTLTSP